jgi:hypothetical protein
MLAKTRVTAFALACFGLVAPVAGSTRSGGPSCALPDADDLRPTA